jgi:soluble lytic murein transglycosylase-like protein
LILLRELKRCGVFWRKYAVELGWGAILLRYLRASSNQDWDAFDREANDAFGGFEMRRRIFRHDPAVWGARGLGPWLLLSLGVVAAGIVLAIQLDKPAPSVPKKNPIVAQAPKTQPPAPQSDFAREAAMSPQALMGRWEPLVAEASKRIRVPAEWIRAVIRMESGGRTMMAENLPIASDMGAMGIMQVLPQTYADMRLQYGLGADPYDPHDNVIAGTAYLKWLYGKYGNPGMFAAYNDGPGNLDAFLTQGRDLPDETHNYVNGISKILGQPSAQFARLTNVQFTRPDGTPIEIDTRSVSAVRAPFPGEYAPAVLSVLSVGKTRQGVREDVAAVTATLRAHGVKI